MTENQYEIVSRILDMDQQDPRVIAQMQYAEALTRARTNNEHLREWHEYAYAEIALVANMRTYTPPEDIPFEPGENVTGLKPEYNLPAQLITVNDIPRPEKLDPCDYMSNEEATQMLDFMTMTVSNNDDLYTALGLSSNITDRELLVKATKARYILDPWSTTQSGRFFHDKYEAEAKNQFECDLLKSKTTFDVACYKLVN